MNEKFVVRMSEIKKSFGTVKAIKNGQFDLKKGEIHSLIGENGAGKSTMMKLLYGLYTHDYGTISINDRVYSKLNPKEAISAGVGMVHQEFMLVDELTVLENIILGFEPRKGISIDFVSARKMIEKYIQQYDMDVQLDKKVSSISVGEAQRVEIIKTLIRGANIIILDEPTAVLTPVEAKRLFEILNKIKNDDKSVVFISHKLNEIMEISDRISVMRQGEYIGTVDKKNTDETQLTKMMIGREVFLNIKKEKSDIKDTVLEVKNLYTSGEKEMSKIRDLSFYLRSGEILGIAGVDGNGQSELIEAITGLRKIEKGKVLLDGKDITNKPVNKIRQAGISHIPEDRNTRGLNKDFSIADNITAISIDKFPFSRFSIISEKEKKKYASSLIEKFDIRPNDYNIKTGNLSGGNAQKVIVAREVSLNSKVLIASQPTRGVDIGAIESIRNILQDVKKKGLGVLLVSADLDEVISLSDRIIVMHEGRITGSLDSDELEIEKLGKYMVGGKTEEKEHEK